MKFLQFITNGKKIKDLEVALQAKEKEIQTMSIAFHKLEDENERFRDALWEIQDKKQTALEDAEAEAYEKAFNTTCDCGKGTLGPLDDGQPYGALYCMACNTVKE